MNGLRDIFTRVRGAGVVLVVGALLLSGSALADERTEYFVRLLQTSSTFKVRAQAALGLGRLESSTESVQALSTALLGDAHPAVRAAAATALGKLSVSSARPALERAQRDSDADVRLAAREALAELSRAPATQVAASRASDSASEARPRPSNGRARFYVGVGAPDTQQVQIADSTRSALRAFLVRQLETLDGVLIAPEGEADPQARSVIEKRKLTGYYVDSSVVSLQRTESGVRAEVSVVLGTYPGRNMKAILRGGATVPGAGGVDAERRAVEGAIAGAVRRISQAMESTIASGQ